MGFDLVLFHETGSVVMTSLPAPGCGYSTTTEVHDCLLKADVDIQTIPGLQAILNLEENNEATNPFKNLNTESQRLSYYKEQFGLKVITCVNILSLAHDILYDSISALNVTLIYLTGTSKNCSRTKRSVP